MINMITLSGGNFFRTRSRIYKALNRPNVFIAFRDEVCLFNDDG